MKRCRGGLNHPSASQQAIFQRKGILVMKGGGGKASQVCTRRGWRNEVRATSIKTLLFPR